MICLMKNIIQLITTNQKLYFLEFEQVCNSAEEFKIELIKHAKKYRSYEL